MNSRSVILAMVALGIAAIAGLMVFSWLNASQKQAQESAQNIEATKVLVAANDLPIGKIIEPQDFKWRTWPKDGLSGDYITNEAAAATIPSRVVRHSIRAGEPILMNRLVAQNEKGFLAAVMAPGMSAVTVLVTRASGLSGLIYPGDRVDMILVHNVVDGQDIERQVSETVMRNVRVLAIDEYMNDQSKAAPRQYKSVTLEVPPTMAEKMAVLQRMGNLTLALRSLPRTVDDTGFVMEADEGVPSTDNPTHSFDAEVSNLLPPLQKDNQMTVSRGSNTSKVIVKGGEN